MSISLLQIRCLISDSIADPIDCLPDLFLALFSEMRSWSWKTQLLSRWWIYLALCNGNFNFTTNIAGLINPRGYPLRCRFSVIPTVWWHRGLTINRSFNFWWLLVLFRVRLPSFDGRGIILIGRHGFHDKTVCDVDPCSRWLASLCYNNYSMMTYLGIAMIRSKGPEIACLSWSASTIRSLHWSGSRERSVPSVTAWEAETGHRIF
jgi:hypothetical protein